MTALNEIERQVAEALDKLGYDYEIASGPHSDEPCAICGNLPPDFEVNGKPYHFECEFPNGGIFR